MTTRRKSDQLSHDEPAREPVVQRHRFKGTAEFIHILFKASVEKLAKNVSFVKGKVSIIPLEHTHVFHTFDSRGRPQQYSSTTGGHFHEVTWGFDANGDPVAKCGPALRSVLKKKPSGAKRVVEPVKWHDEDNDDTVRDDHKHDWAYIHSERMSESKVNEMQRATRATVAEKLGGEQPRTHGPGAGSGLDADVDGTRIQTDDD